MGSRGRGCGNWEEALSFQGRIGFGGEGEGGSGGGAEKPRASVRLWSLPAWLLPSAPRLHFWPVQWSPATRAQENSETGWRELWSCQAVMAERPKRGARSLSAALTLICRGWRRGGQLGGSQRSALCKSAVLKPDSRSKRQTRKGRF